jgi:hypothetical protein
MENKQLNRAMLIFASIHPFREIDRLLRKTALALHGRNQQGKPMPHE